MAREANAKMTDPAQCMVLAGLANMIGARTIVEAGTYRGAAARALGEHNPEARVWTADIVERPEVEDLPPNTRFYHGDFVDMLHAIKQPIDFAYIDASGASNRETELRWSHALHVLPKLSPRGIIAWDDTWSQWEGADKIRAFANINILALKGLSLYQKPE